MKLVPIDRYWHSHEYQMSSLALPMRQWIPAEFITEWPSNETAGRIPLAPITFHQISNFSTFSIFYVWKGLEKLEVKKELVERDERQDCHTPQTCLLHWDFDRVKNTVHWVCDSSLWRAYQERWIFCTLPNKSICLIIKKELECLLPKDKG